MVAKKTMANDVSNLLDSGSNKPARPETIEVTATVEVAKSRYLFGNVWGGVVQGKSMYNMGTYTRDEAMAMFELYKCSGRRDVHMFVLIEMASLADSQISSSAAESEINANEDMS